jgi:hypothetical protein
VKEEKSSLSARAKAREEKSFGEGKAPKSKKLGSFKALAKKDEKKRIRFNN